MQTVNEILTGQTRLEELPLITVIHTNGFYFSLNNRRLFMLKHLLSLGHPLTENGKVRVRTKEALARETERYTLERCSLHAKLMQSKKSDGGDAQEENENDENEEKEEKNIENDEGEDKIRESGVEIALKNNNESKNDCEASNLDSDPQTSAELTKPKSRRDKKDKKGGFKPYPSAVLSSMNSLTLLIEKNKSKNVVAKLREWFHAQVISEEEVSKLVDELGLEARFKQDIIK